MMCFKHRFVSPIKIKVHGHVPSSRVARLSMRLSQGLILNDFISSSLIIRVIKHSASNECFLAIMACAQCLDRLLSTPSETSLDTGISDII